MSGPTPRQRRVRYIYPLEMMDVAIALCLRCGMRTAAKTLSLPLSTMYRWLTQYRRAPERHGGAERACRGEGLQDLIASCAACGFDVRAARAALERSSAPGIPMIAGVADRPDEAQDWQIQPEPEVALPMRQSSDGRSGVDQRISSEIPDRDRERLELARRKIESRYYSKLSCEMLANESAMSKWHFIRSFKTAFAVSPYHYLIQVRIRQAKRLLHTTSQPMDAVATAVGFDTLSSLCRAFRSVEGVSLSSVFRGIRIGCIPGRRMHATRNAQGFTGPESAHAGGGNLRVVPGNQTDLQV